MLIEALLAWLAVAVLVAGAISLAQVAAIPVPEEPPQGDAERRPPPIVLLIMIDSSGESAAALAEFYRHYDRKGA